MRNCNLAIKNGLHGEQGFTLIETLIALLVFTVGIMAVMTMTISAMNGYSRSRTTTTEVNRTCLNIEGVKQAAYTALDVFSGIDGGIYDDTEDAVVRGTRLVVMQNDTIKGSGVGGTYQVYYTKPLIQ